MRQETINIYQFEELSDDAKQKAIEWYLADIEIFWGDEWMNSVQEFCECFDIKIRDWQYGADCVHVKIDVNYADADKGNKEVTKEWFESHKLKDFPFTGYCGDETLLAPLRALKEGEKVRFASIMQDCISSWQSAFFNDIQYQLYDEDNARENIIMTEYEFNSDGSKY